MKRISWGKSKPTTSNLITLISSNYDNYDILWIISSDAADWELRNPSDLSTWQRFVDCCETFHRSGRGIFIFADNYPFYDHRRSLKVMNPDRKCYTEMRYLAKGNSVYSVHPCNMWSTTSLLRYDHMPCLCSRKSSNYCKIYTRKSHYFNSWSKRKGPWSCCCRYRIYQIVDRMEIDGKWEIYL